MGVGLFLHQRRNCEPNRDTASADANDPSGFLLNDLSLALFLSTFSIVAICFFSDVKPLSH